MVIKLIKGLFSKPPKIEEKSLNLAQVQEFILKREEKAKQEILVNTNESIKKIDEAKVYCYSRIEDLENSELANKQIPAKLISIMQGNRQTYAKFIRLFLDNLKIDYTNISKTTKELEQLNKNTLKSYLTLKHFFEEEAYAIAKQIKIISVEVEKIEKSVLNSDIENARVINEVLSQINNKNNKNSELSIKIEEAYKNESKLIAEIEKIRLEIKNITSSKEHIELIGLIEQKNEQTKGMKKLNDDINDILLPFSHALKKHQRYALEKGLIEEYSKSLQAGLMIDSKLAIIDELNKMSNNLEKLGVTGKKKEKIESLIANLNRQKLIELRDDSIKTNEEIQKIELVTQANQSTKKIDKLNELVKSKENAQLSIQNEQQVLIKQKATTVDLVERLKELFLEKFSIKLDLLA